MTTANTTLQVSDLDFFSIRDNLKNFLRSQSTFTDYDFEGSGMAVLLDVLAYNTHYNAYYLNMVANESFLDTAQIRSNILSHAKLINYIPSSAQGSVSMINVKVTPSDVENKILNTLTLDKYTRFLGQDLDGINYPFVTLNSNTAAKVNGSFTFANVAVKQGEVVTLQYEMTANNTQRKFQIPSTTVDTTTLSVTVQESSTDTRTYEYNPVTDLTEIAGDSLVYFLEENEESKYSLYFGDGVIGNKPKNGNIIILTYLNTVGSISNNISNFINTESIGGLYRDNVVIKTVSSSYGGSDKEDIESIRFRAPYHYITQNRAVTVNDYETLILKDYNNISAVSIWGGEDNDPPVYGKVYMSLKTRGYYTLSNLEKETIKNTLIQNRNVLTIIPEIVDPEYVFIQVQGKVYYNPTLTSKTAAEISSIVTDTILKYNDDELNGFKSIFRKSRLQYYIDTCEKSITGSDIKIFMQKRLPISVNAQKNYSIKFNTALTKGDFFDKFNTYPQVRVVDANKTFRDVFIEEVPNSFTGIKQINVTNSGINYLTTPTVTILGDGTGATAKATVAGGKVLKIEVVNSGLNYTRATVTITGEGSEAQAVPVLDQMVGTLRTFYYKNTGEKVIVNNNAGTINYETGEIVLSQLTVYNVTQNDFYGSDILAVNVVPDEDVIYPMRNRIVSIDYLNKQSINIEAIAES